MNIQDIKELARVMQETGLTSLHVTEGALDIHMEQKRIRCRRAGSASQRSGCSGGAAGRTGSPAAGGGGKSAADSKRGPGGLDHRL